MEEADVQNSNESGCTRIRVYKARNPRQYYGQTESLLQYLKSKNSSVRSKIKIYLLIQLIIIIST